MKARVCICCGEPMRDPSAQGAKDPNMCASCTSLLDLTDWYKESREAALRADSPPLEMARR